MSPSNNTKPTSSTIDLYNSQLTIPSDSENYDFRMGSDTDVSSVSSDDSLIPYRRTPSWIILRRCLVNLFLPFVNGLMLGFGELFAHEAAFRMGWSNTNVFPIHRRTMGLRNQGSDDARRDDKTENRGISSWFNSSSGRSSRVSPAL